MSEKMIMVWTRMVMENHVYPKKLGWKNQESLVSKTGREGKKRFKDYTNFQAKLRNW